MRSPRFGPFARVVTRLLTVLACGVLAGGAVGQNFTQPKVIPTGNWPAAMYTADMNGDGIRDLVYIDQGATETASTTHVLLGDGKGNFKQSAVLATAGQSIVLLPISGHNIPDILYIVDQPGTTGAQILAYIGNGDGTFSPNIFSVRTITAAADHKFAYFSSLGVFGVGVEDTANDVLYTFGGCLVNCNVISFETLNLPQGTGPIFTANLNGSSVPAIVVDGLSGFAAQVFVGSTVAGVPSTPGTPSSVFGGASGVHSMLLQDVNGDGKPDLIAEGANGRIDVFFGNGDGTFQTTSSGGTGTLDGTTGNGGHLIAVGDLNHDGLPDALAITPAGVSSLLGNGTAYLGLKGIYNAGPTGGSGTPSYAVADFNGDGNLDLAVDSPEGIAILFGNADGSFQTNAAFAAGAPAMSGALGAFSQSRHVDAVVATGPTQAQVLHGAGDGTFVYLGYGYPNAPITTGTAGGAPGLWSTVQAGDFNGDGNLDLLLVADGPTSAMAGPGIGAVVIPGNGQSGFATPAPVNSAAYASVCPGALAYGFGMIAVADFNGDGIPDFALRDSAATLVYQGRSIQAPLLNEGLPNAVEPTCQALPHNMAVAGAFGPTTKPELVVEEAGHLLLYANDGKGNIGFPSSGDLAVDGSLTTAGQPVAPLLSTIFEGTSPTLGFPAAIGSMAVGDVDRDGNQDLIVAYANLSANLTAPSAAAPNYLYIWYGSGNGKFLTSAKHPVNPVRLTLSRNYYQVAVADVNGDGIPDLILSDGYILSVQLGVGDGTFGAETHYLAGQGINSISVGDVNGDGKPDLVLANGGAVLTNPVANLETLATNPDVNTGGITVLLNRAAATLPTPTGTLAATPEPTTYGNPFTLTANFIPLAVVSAPLPTGNITFSVDNTVVGSATLAGGTATIVVPASTYATLAVGTHTLTGMYSGDANYGPTTLNGTHTVTQIPTTVSLLLCVDPPGSNFPCGNPIESTPLISPITLYYGQVLDGVAIESESDLTGTLTFYSGSYVFCVLNANLQQGAQTCPPSLGYQGVGTTTDTAVYSGDATHLGATSNGIVVTVLADSTTATVTSSVNPSTFGQLVTFTASVQGNYAPATGMVQLLDGTNVIGTATLDPTGAATFAISTLAVGTHPITVAYAATLNFNAATSAVLNQVVNAVLTPVASAVTLISSINPSAPGQPVTFTATVTVPGPFAIVPTGSVTFLDGTNPLATVALNSLGIATFTTSTLVPGPHSITASYGGAAAIGGAGPVQPPNPPKPPKPLVQGMTLAGPGMHTAGTRTVLPSVSAPLRAGPRPQATAGTPQILASVSAVLVQVVTYPLNEQPSGFALTVSPVPVALSVGGQAVLLVTVNEFSGFNQPVQLGCSELPNEATCTFVQPTIPAGGGSTTLYLAVAAPHACGSSTPLFAGGLAWPRIGGAVMALLVLLPGVRRRKGLLALVGLCGLAALSGCGNCTDLGTRPGNYTFTVSGTAGSTTESQAIKLAVTI